MRLSSRPREMFLRCRIASIALCQRIDKIINFADASKIMCNPITLNRVLLRAGSLIAGE